MEKYLLGINNGESDIRCVLFDLNGKEIASDTMHLELPSSRTSYAERDSETIWKENVSVIANTLTKAQIDPSDILCIGITGYGNGLLLLDEEKKEVYPAIISTDMRANSLCLKMKNEGIEKTLYPLTRSNLWAGQPAVLLPWFKENKPYLLEKTRWIVSIKDFIRFRLTGQLHGEETQASSIGLMNLSTRKYDPFIFETLGISDCFDKFPDILKSTQIAGTISAQAAELTGLKEGTKVCAGYYDIGACALGSGILSYDELCLITGTWSINGFLVGSVSDRYEKRTNTATLSCIDGLYLMEDSTQTSISNFNWYVRKIIRKYAPDLRNEEAYRECDDLVQMSGPEESSVIFVPYLYASVGHPEANGAFLNLTAGDDSVSLLRAIYEGIVFSIIHHIHKLKRPLSSYSGIKLSGGIVHSSVWTQILSDALQMPITTIKGTHSGAKGAAIGAGIACGAFQDPKEAVARMVHVNKTYIPRKRYAEIYQKKYRRYQAALETLDQLAEKISEI